MFQKLSMGLVALTWAVGCGSDGGEAAKQSPVCAPGKTETCACPGAGETGAQTCNSDGQAWGACLCSPEEAAGAGSGGRGAGHAGSDGTAGAGTSAGDGGATSGASSGYGGLGGGYPDENGHLSATCLHTPLSAQDGCSQNNLETYQGDKCPKPCGSAAYGVPVGYWCCPAL